MMGVPSSVLYEMTDLINTIDSDCKNLEDLNNKTAGRGPALHDEGESRGCVAEAVSPRFSVTFPGFCERIPPFRDPPFGGR